MKTLLLALISPGKSSGTREGAIRGLVGVGKEAVRKGLVEGGGAKVVAAEWEADGQSITLVNSVLVSHALQLFRRIIMTLLFPRMHYEPSSPSRTCQMHWTPQRSQMLLLLQTSMKPLAISLGTQ